MAGIVAGGGVTVATSTNAATYISGSFTPTAGNLLAASAGVTGQTATDWAVTDSLGGSWTKIRRAVKNASADIMEFWVRDSPVDGSAMTVTFSHASGNATGCFMKVFEVSGMSRTGSSAVRQSAGQDNQAAAGTPAPAFAVAALSANLCLGVVHNATNPATLTPPASWTERNDGGYNTPATGAETATRDSGETGTTITWGSTSASAFSCLIVEFDASRLISFSQASETDTAQAITGRKVGTLGLATETDAAQAITRKSGQTVAFSAALETDGGQSLSGRKTGTFTAATDAESAQAITGQHRGTLNASTESDSAGTLTGTKRGTHALTSESNAAAPLNGRKTGAFAQANESDAPGLFAGLKRGNLGVSWETDAAEAWTGSKTGAFSLASEGDAAEALSGQKTRPYSVAAETDEALEIHELGAPLSFSLAGETEQAGSFVGLKLGLYVLAEEIDLAGDLAGTKRGILTVALEGDLAGLLSKLGAARIIAYSAAMEVDAALCLNPGDGQSPVQGIVRRRGDQWKSLKRTGGVGVVRAANWKGRIKCGGR